MIARLWLSCLALGACSVCTAGDAPAVVWSSSPVRPGEHVLVHGGAWGADPRVEIGGRTVTPDRVTASGLVFPFPKDVPACTSARIVSASGASAPFALNAPEVWWMQGDGGDRSAPGGTLRLFGRCLSAGGSGCRTRSSFRRTRSSAASRANCRRSTGPTR